MKTTVIILAKRPEGLAVHEVKWLGDVMGGEVERQMKEILGRLVKPGHVHTDGWRNVQSGKQRVTIATVEGL